MQEETNKDIIFAVTTKLPAAKKKRHPHAAANVAPRYRSWFFLRIEPSPPAVLAAVKLLHLQ
jgi:hypothetical protein